MGSERAEFQEARNVIGHDAQPGSDHQDDDDELPPVIGERYRDVLHDINHAANHAADQ